MPNWCYSTIAFYQEDEKNDRLELLYQDLEKYIDYQKKESSGWIGSLLKAKEVDTENLSCRAFICYLDCSDDYFKMDLKSAWVPMPTAYEKIAELYDLKMVYIAEEHGSTTYVNTDIEGRHFLTRYLLTKLVDISDEIKEKMSTDSRYDDILKDLGKNIEYFETFEDVQSYFRDVKFDTLDELNALLNRVDCNVFRFESDDSDYKD